MGVVHNRIRIDELESGGGGGIDTRLTHLENEYTDLVTHSLTEEKEVGEWYNGATIYKKSFECSGNNSFNDDVGAFKQDISDLNIDKMVKNEGSLVLTSGNQTNFFYANMMNNILTVGQNINSGKTSWSGIVTIYYTKNEE